MASKEEATAAAAAAAACCCRFQSPARPEAVEAAEAAPDDEVEELVWLPD